MSLSDISIRNPVFAWMLMAALLVFGGIGFMRLGVSQLPDVDFPVVTVSETLEGAAPEVMEVDVVDPIEDAIMGIQGVTNITSSSKMGRATITVEFDLDKKIDTAVQEIQNTIAQVQKRLPRETEPPVVMKTNPEDNPIMWLAVSSTQMKLPELMAYVRDYVKDKFSTVTGVGEVILGGYIQPNLRVWLNANKLNQYELTTGDIINTIQLEHSELPAGRIEGTTRELNIRTLGEAPTPEEFAKLTINRRGGAPNFTPLQLGQVATIEDGLADIRGLARSMGRLSVGLGIRKQRGANAVDVAHAVKKKMAEISSALPKGTELGVRFDATQFIEDAIHELNFTLALSAILTALVCWLFLGSWSATVNVIMSIPTSIVGSFFILYLLGFTLNTFTLLGLSLAIGIVVDDSIMVLENIVRNFEMGKDRMSASLTGAREITFAAIAATAAIIAIFLPVAFMQGIIGKFLYQFGVTLSVAVALSLLEALTLTPMRCSQFMSVEERHTRIGKFVEESFHTLSVLYEKILRIVLAHRWKTIAISIAACIASFAVQKALNKEFVPPQDQGRLLIRIQAPLGSSIDYMDKKLAEAEKMISDRPELDKYFASIGGFGGGDVNVAVLFITFKDLKQRGINPKTNKYYTQQELGDLYRQMLKQIPDLRVVVQDLSLSGFTAKRGFPVEFTVRGPDWNELGVLTHKMMERLESTGALTDIDTDYQEGMPEVRVLPDRTKATQRGVSVYDIAQTINVAMGGVVAGKFSKNGHSYDVRVRLVSGERNDPKDILKLRVRNNRGELVSLKELVKLEEHKTLQSISRQNRERAISVFANVAKGGSQAHAIELVQQMAQEILPQGYRVVVSGSSQTFKESFQSLLFALILGLLVSYMVLGSQFNSFVHPFTVLLALPFSVSGAFVSLWLGHQSLNIFSMIGLVLLMGIVKKNSILLVDFTNQVIKKGASPYDALIKACPMRLRPILMTSIATMVGALPAALAIGPGAESRIPMALAILGGVFVSTALTLIVVPCVYSLFASRVSPIS